MNISLFNDWLEDRLFGEGQLASLIADIVDEAMSRDKPGDFGPSERVDESLLAEAWATAQTEDEIVRFRTAIVLGRLGYAPAQPPLEDARRSADPTVAGAATVVLARTRAIDDELLQALIGTIQNPAESRELRTSAAQAVASRQTLDGTTALLKIAQSEDPELAQYGVEGLGLTRWPQGTETHGQVFDALMAALSKEDLPLKAAAAEALGNLGDPAAVSELELLLIEKDVSLRRRVLFALARLRAESAKAPLARMLRDYSVPARWEIVDLVAECYGEPMIDALAAATRTSDPELHDHIVVALGKMNGPASCQLLRKISEEQSDPFVKEQALSALARRGDQPEEVPCAAGAPPASQPPPPPPAAPVPSAPQPPAASAPKAPRLQPIYTARPEAEPAGRGDLAEVIERALQAMACTWRPEPQGYQVEVPVAGGTELVSIVLSEVDCEGAAICRFVVNCGPADGAAYEAALRNNRLLDYGALAIDDASGSSLLVLIDTLPAGAGTVAVVRKVLTSLAQSARQLRGA